jgi:hypothetical protein
MAKRKTVSISPKPSAAPLLEPEAMAAPDKPPAVPADRGRENVNAPPALPGLNPFGWAVYSTVFCVSYSVVFSAMLFGAYIPGGGLIGRGLCDGAAAARGEFRRPASAEADPASVPAGG